MTIDKKERKKSLGLYVHIPFCSFLCHYCDFPKTAIWDKTPDPENNEFIGTDYEESLKKFYKIVIEFGRNGWDPKMIGDKVLQIIQNQKPSPRNIITPNKFTNYILSGILPTRIYDKIITNKLNLKKIM